MFNLIIAAALFFLLVFSTFFVVQLPFIVFFPQDLPTDLIINYSYNFVKIGYFQSNLQIPVFILCSLLLNPRLSVSFIITYFIIGLSGMPIFYNGGGVEYLSQNSIGYLFALLPTAFFISSMAWKDNDVDRYLYNTRFTFFISCIALLFIHIMGIAIYYFKFNGSISLLNIIQAYFFIPILSQVLLVAVFSILAADITRFKFYCMGKYKSILKSSVTTTKRRIIVKPKRKRKNTQELY